MFAMTGQVTLPVWLFILLVLVAVWAALDLMLLPAVRWYFRRKVNRLIHDMNARLKIELPQFKLTRRHVLIDRLVHDRKVQEAVERESREKAIPRSVLMTPIDPSARRIGPAFNACFHFLS